MLWKNLSVIPAKAGHVGQWREIHSFQIVKKGWIPFFKGMTTFCSGVIQGKLVDFVTAMSKFKN